MGKDDKKSEPKKSKASTKSAKSASKKSVESKSKTPKDSSAKVTKGDSKKTTGGDDASKSKVSKAGSKDPSGSKVHDHGKAGKEAKKKLSPRSLKEALKDKREPMGGAAGIHGHGKKGSAVKKGDPAHPHHGSHTKAHPHHHHNTSADGAKRRTSKIRYHKHHHRKKHHTFEGYDTLPTEEIYEVSTLAKRFVRGFLPIRVLLAIGGRFPLTMTRNERDGTYSYKCAWYLPHGWFFLFNTFLIFLIICVLIFNFVLYKARFQLSHYLGRKWNIKSFILPWVEAEEFDVTYKKKPNKLTRTKLQIELHEDIVFNRHLFILIVFMLNLINALIGSFSIIRKRRYLVRYFTVWTKATEKLYMDIGKGMFTFSLTHVLVFSGFIVTMSLLYGFHVGSTSRGGPTLLALLLFRPFRPELFKLNTGDLYNNKADKTYREARLDYMLPIFQLAGEITLLVSFLWSKSILLVFIYKCQLLINSFGNFNGRVYATVLRGREYNQTEDGRAAYKILFKDHCVLLDLMEGTDRFFSLILESFFGLHICSLMVEVYFTLLYLRTARDRNSERKTAEVNHYFVRRDAEFVVGLLICLLNILFLIRVSGMASNVGDEACAGLEVVRRKTMLGRKTDEELYFNFSMYNSYIAYKGCILRSGGYFDLNKDFMVGLFSAFLSYFIIVEQFHPYFDKSDNQASKAFDSRGRIGIFLHKLENLADCHWVNPSALIKDPHDCKLKAKN